MKATFKVKLINDPTPPPPPFVGTIVGIETTKEHPVFAFHNGKLAEGASGVRVDWGDGSVEELPQLSSASHAYAASGAHEIRISDSISTFGVSSRLTDSEYYLVSAPMLRSVRSNATRLVSTASYAFFGCRNLREFDVSVCSLSELGVAAFKDCVALSGVLFLRNVADIKGANPLPFAGCANLAEIHFALANAAAIRATQAYRDDPTLGTGVEGVCRFDP